MMRYTVYYQENLKVKKTELTKEELEKGNLPNNTFKIKKRYKIFSEKFYINKTISEKRLKNIFYQLSVMLESKILLNDALEILIKNEKDIYIKEFLTVLNSSLTNSKFTLENFRVSNLVNSFFNIIHEGADAVSNIKILSEILNENYEIKKEFKKVMFYPLILLFTFLFALIGIFKFVIPKFELMFTQYSMKLSFSTKLLFFIKDIYENYLLTIFFVVLFLIVTLIYFYKRFIKFRYFIGYFLANKIWIISDIYMAKVFYEFFFSIENLLKNRYKFHDSFTKSKVLIENYYLLDKITQIENLLKSGKSIEFSLTQSKLFDELVLSLIRTGEISNSLEVTISEIKNIYKKRFDDSLKIFSTLIEPLFFIIIMALVLWIVFAIFVPLWGLNDMLKV